MKSTTLIWIGAGLAFVAYPVLRPYADESTLAGLVGMGSERWVAAHVLGMVGFVLLAVGITRRTGSGGLASVAVALLLPYYGAETFGLHAVGTRAATTGDLSLLQVVADVRYQPVAVAMFGLGLVLLALAGVRLVLARWSTGGLERWSALAVAAGLALYLPQFFGTPELRIAHGVLLGIGCVALGLAPEAARQRPSAGQDDQPGSRSRSHATSAA